MKLDPQLTYIQALEAHARRYISILESIFGPRDARFVFGTVRKSNGCPRTDFPKDFHYCGECEVDILVSEHPWNQQSQDQGAWQVAHERVHLSDL